MKKVVFTLTVALMSLCTYAQMLPKPSPLAKVSQVVGATEVSLEYSRPGVKGRKVFGELLPYGQIWRLGANASTKFTTTSDLMIDGKELKAGTYAMFAIPKDDGNWTIAFNSDIAQSGTADYTDEKDILRVEAKVTENSFTETLLIGFDKIAESSANIVILWEDLRVDVPFTVDTKTESLKNIDDAVKKGERLDEVYYNAANYYYGSLNEYDEALVLVEKSIDEKETYRNLFLKARILEKQGKKKKAIPLAKKALVMAEEDGSKGFAGFISGTLESWK